MTGPEKEGSMKVGVFTVGLPDLTPEEAVREIKDAGYDGVEWRVARVPEDVRDEEPSFWGNNLCTLAPTEADACRARRLSEEAGLGVPGLGTYVGVGDLGAAEEAMRFAVTAGAPRCGWEPEPLTGVHTRSYSPRPRSFCQESRISPGPAGSRRSWRSITRPSVRAPRSPTGLSRPSIPAW